MTTEVGRNTQHGAADFRRSDKEWMDDGGVVQLPDRCDFGRPVECQAVEHDVLPLKPRPRYGRMGLLWFFKKTIWIDSPPFALGSNVRHRETQTGP